MPAKVQRKTSNWSMFSFSCVSGPSSSSHDHPPPASIRKEVEWRGTPLGDLNGDLRFHFSPVEGGRRSTLLHSGSETYLWDQEHVRMPFCPQNDCEVYDDRLKKRVRRSRWELVQQALRHRPLSNAQDLQDMILRYNLRDRWDFGGLADYVRRTSRKEWATLFRKTLPDMTDMCLSLDSLITEPIPMLRGGEDRSLTFSQRQIASLLANAFFCTFPWRNQKGKETEYAEFPDINFSGLFAKSRGYGSRDARRNSFSGGDKPKYLDIGGGGRRGSDTGGSSNIGMGRSDFVSQKNRDGGGSHNCRGGGWVNDGNYKNRDGHGGTGGGGVNGGGERQRKAFFSFFGRSHRHSDSNSVDSFGGVKEEKLKCIFNYFRRRSEEAKDHDTLVTFHRRCLSQDQLPNWAGSDLSLRANFYISSGGSIECEGATMLQVDFANAFVGGGVLGNGSVQEEIMFLYCPELILARLFTERLQDHECLVVTGFERYNRNRGYASTFAFAGDFKDESLIDERSNQRKTRMVAMDARRFRTREEQFTRENIMRELNKAYVGFCNNDEGDHPLAVATGNWGCGIYGGDPHLKSLIQLMAAAQAGRDMAYFTFGDRYLRDEIYEIYGYLQECDVSVGRLFCLICDYGELIVNYRDNGLYSYLRKNVKPVEPVDTRLKDCCQFTDLVIGF